MKSIRVKLKKEKKYFRVDYNFYNNIEAVWLVNKKNATLFQPEAHVIEGKGGKMKIGEIRCSAFSLYLLRAQISKNDIELEELEAPEQPIFSAAQRKQFREEYKMLQKFSKQRGVKLKL